MSRVLDIKIYSGISNIFRYNTIFMELLNTDIIDKINVSICKSTILKTRGEYDIETWFSEWGIVLKFIMCDDRIKYTTNQGFNLEGYYEVGNRYGITPMIKLYDNLIDVSVMNRNKLPKNYITISPKIWASIPKLVYEKYKTKFLDILNEYNGVVIIMGERNITYCDEYRVIETYSIYEDLITNLNNYQDLTISETTDNLKLEPLKDSLHIINKSDLNVVMTFSGLREIALFMSENVVALTPPIIGDWSDVYINIDEIKYDTKNIHLTYNISDFLGELGECIKIENLKL